MARNNRHTVIKYAGHRILLETVASYGPIFLSERNSATKYGIRFTLRNGLIEEALGNDELSRNKFIAFLDKHFKPTEFLAYKCDVCSNFKDNGYGSCDLHCNDYNNYRHFKREEKDDTRSMDASD